jgi:hypothetical protein
LGKEQSKRNNSAVNDEQQAARKIIVPPAIKKALFIVGLPNPCAFWCSDKEGPRMLQSGMTRRNFISSASST